MKLKEKIDEFLEPIVARKIRELIQQAQSLGLSKADVENALEMLEANEWGVSFDTVVVQLYEHEVPVTQEFIELAEEIMDQMAIERTEYQFLYKLPKRPPTE